MKLIQLFIFLSTYRTCSTRYSFYQSNNKQTFDCLYSHIQYSYETKNGAYLTLYHLVPYCRRLNESETLVSIPDENVQNKISFKDLSRNGITSSQLLDWFAPIDIAEEYEINGKYSDEFFYNCSSPWFGSTCQYQLIDDKQVSFGRLVRLTFRARGSPPPNISGFPVGTCYPFLTSCIRGPSPICLDWREICNGIYDCVDGTDEQFCHLLKQNQCANDEFQCQRSKECIPRVFLKDQEDSLDCLDGSDEVESVVFEPGNVCFRLATFECEEIAYGVYNYFSCGDGEIKLHSMPRFDYFCSNLRDQHTTMTLFTSFDYISNFACRQFLICSIRPDRIKFLSHLQNQIHCNVSLEQCPLEWLVFPQYPILYSFFQFVYFTNRTISPSSDDVTPDLVCFNVTRCPAYLFCSVDIGMRSGLHCCNARNITRGKMYYWRSFQNIFPSVLQNCFRTTRNENYLSIDKERNPSGSIDNQWVNSPKTFVFGYFCNDYINIKDNTETDDNDETDCHFWPCNNPYTRCDRYLHCLNGIDELNCPNSPCLSNELSCEETVWESSDIHHCLSVAHLVDDYTKFDPRTFSRVIFFKNETIENVTDYLFWNDTKCITMEHLYHGHFVSSTGNEDVCLIPKYPKSARYGDCMFSRNNKILCRFDSHAYYASRQRPFLQSSRLGYFPMIKSEILNQSSEVSIKEPTFIYLDANEVRSWYCNRGFAVLYRNNQTMECLCPPAYFGPRCQWQNQRVSLTFRLKHFAFTYEMPIFQVILMLIDDQGQISPYHEQTIHLPKRDCGIKYNFYLLYPSQPKNSSMNYSVRIDVFNRRSLTHWASWHLPILFPFLPVNRISAYLLIPLNPQETEFSCPLSCENHGKCLKYANTNLSYFCQCDSGYSGSNCQLKHNCSCSADSFCLSSSICICPLYKFGSKCSLTRQVCQSSENPCKNGGQCVPIDDRLALNNFTCLCKEEFFGDQCENVQNRIDIEFNAHKIAMDSPILIHLITIYETSNHSHSTILKQMKYGQNQLTIRTTNPFHLVFVEILQEGFYLIVKREQFIKFEHIQTKLSVNSRCTFVNELLNESSHYLYRMKFYPQLCRQNKQLMCFYDEIYMCICDEDRFSNCFSFNRNTTYDCDQSENPCENNGKCFITNRTCSSTLKCLCSGCFYGTKCQFTTEGFVLSLDYILSYHIKPKLSFSHQPFIVKMSVGIVTVMFLMGFIGGLLLIATFRENNTRTTGCGLYLFASGWTSIFIVCVLVMKFSQLLLLQLKSYDNLFILRFNCILLDALIKILLAINDWLDGCVSIERVITVKQGIKFDKKKSKRMAKWMILFVTLLSIFTHLHDPLHRQLIEDIDIDEERIWCITQYSPSTSIYNSFITLFHFLAPFTINFFSTIIIIIAIARNRSVAQQRLTYVEHLKLQFNEHKHHFIASFTLVFLGLPRLVISFISGCMKSPIEADPQAYDRFSQYDKCSTATWSKQGITVAGGHGFGRQLNQLADPLVA
ncbi:unnamed protein product [Adineta ricciae]|uniref:Uncharacterized protein n=1 Tax=Adineta ricciae TaxID=249248 RepID=A0A816A779_ADIRI|nr:unnamed protein product [Adineta ricciae]